MRLREARTISEAIEQCRDSLRRVSPTPWLDARLLAQHVTGLDASAIIAYGEANLDGRRREKLFELAARRAAGEPVAYITGKKSFCGLELRVDKRVLVPRPETEQLVLACVDDWSGLTPDIADIGTGSGAIACALAHILPGSRVVASDVSAAALQVAADNAAALGLCDQISFLESDIFNQHRPQLTFDVIMANLPYVATETVSQLDAGVRAHEPALALLAGPDGLDVYRRLFSAAARRLRPEGCVYCECSPENARGLAALAQSAFPQAKVQLRKDLAGFDRVLICSATKAAS